MNFEHNNTPAHPDTEREFPQDSKEPFPAVEISDFFTIELTGGAFRGFVTTRSEKHFHDFVVDKRAFWDSLLSKTVLITAETSALEELRPERRAFEIKFAKTSVTGEPLDDASFILRPVSQEILAAQVRSHALDLHKVLRELIDDTQAQLNSENVLEVLQGRTLTSFQLSKAVSTEIHRSSDAETRLSRDESASTASGPLPESERKDD
jgi:hypothetical protein